MLAPRREQQLGHGAGTALGLTTRGQQTGLRIGPGPNPGVCGRDGSFNTYRVAGLQPPHLLKDRLQEWPEPIP
jgi:hypothetical protein